MALFWWELSFWVASGCLSAVRVHKAFPRGVQEVWGWRELSTVLLVRTLMLWDQGSTVTALFTLNWFFGGPISKYSPTGGGGVVRASMYEFSWWDTNIQYVTERNRRFINLIWCSFKFHPSIVWKLFLLSRRWRTGFKIWPPNVGAVFPLNVCVPSTWVWAGLWLLIQLGMLEVMLCDFCVWGAKVDATFPSLVGTFVFGVQSH